MRIIYLVGPSGYPVRHYDLDDAMGIGHVVRIQPSEHDSVKVYDAHNIMAPECDDDGNLSLPIQWRTITNGYTGQYGYRGPCMHSSEYIGGGLARDILARPGLYVALATPNGESWIVAHRPECWHVGANMPGYLPESEPVCFLYYADACAYLREEMEEWADRDDENATDVINSTVPEGEQESAHEETATRATVDAILADDGPADVPGPWGATVSGNDDRSLAWWVMPIDGCEHIECDHDDNEMW